ncbi:hypothetical protein JOC93_001325 [Priestia taiwanensis]|uniref:Uncharacterized protein n=2 Tax=Priestia taiwanensis TaxID=1347902 RepID=A0A917APQ5_9BACI|nr:hypothetical protein [Priestia taiwanensis]GGE64369.1 hypothetical protein GCM10007140_13240 [Priestia taiwanensis]
MTNQTENNINVTQDGNQLQNQALTQVTALVEQLLKSLTQVAAGQDGGQILTKAMPILEKLMTQLAQKPAQPNEDAMPGNDNKFMEIDDIVDNLVNAGMITAGTFTVNVELFRGSPITVSVVKPGEKDITVKKDLDAGESITEEVETGESGGNEVEQPKEAQ